MTIGKPMGNFRRRDEHTPERAGDWRAPSGGEIADEARRRAFGIGDDADSLGEGGYARDLDYGRRSALGHGGYGGFGYAEHNSGAYGFGTRQYIGRGPRGYLRSDQRIHEDVCEALTDDPYLDASDIEVEVTNREVFLRGVVSKREEKRRAADLCENIRGIADVHNELRIDDSRLFR